VPKLKGKSLKKAKGLLKSHDCRLGRVTHAFSTKVKKGRVISSKPKAGKHLTHLAKVRLVLSKGKK
jgi:beta-lactam-binding protein with PASTA domain